jgi:RND superfamily putative drug exporter
LGTGETEIMSTVESPRVDVHPPRVPPRASGGRRRLRAGVAALVLVWLVVGAVAGPYAGKLADIAEDDNAAFLPSSAESARVAELQRAFTDDETLPAILVWENPDGITEDVTAQATREVAKLRELRGVAGEVSPPIPSRDGKALIVVVPLDGGLGDAVTEVVAEIRTAVADTSGAEVYVTGPAGLAGDLEEAFSGIDGILLLVALGVVLLILLTVYRSPILPFLVLFSAVLALGLAAFVVYELTDAGVIELNGQSQGILSILVVGAATDYALLLVARFREELREEDDRFAAMRIAWRQTAAPVTASAVTVILGVLSLLFSDLNSNRSLGPVAAIGIASALVVSLTFLPAALALLGRAAFWPFRPQYRSEHPEASGVWGRLSRAVGRRPRRTWVGVTLLLAVAAAFAPTLSASGVSQLDMFLEETDSKVGQAALSRHFPGGSGTPVVVIASADQLPGALQVVEETEGVASAAVLAEESGAAAGQAGPLRQGRPRIVDGRGQIEVTLTAAADSESGLDVVRALRNGLDEVGEEVLVGGQSAQQLDTNEIGVRDRTVIIPIVLAVIFLVLVLLLRALVVPVLLVATVVLSYFATLGVAALVFEQLMGWPGADPSVPLFGFVFLVALGIDYNIFLMTRVREESLRIGTRQGVLRGLSVTGGVITSAGLVLAATFAALGVIPILFLAQIAFIVAFGVLLDTLIVRSLLVPALVHDIGPKVWWPSALSRGR